MTNEEVRQLLLAQLGADHVAVDGDGSHYGILVVSERFAGLTPVKKQQLVYSVLNDKITDGSMHAVKMQTLTPAEWASRQSQMAG